VRLLRNKILLTSLVTIFVIAGMFPISIVAQPKEMTKLSSENAQIYVEVRDAFYADLDGDGLEDDVHTYIYLKLTGSKNFNFDYYLTLTLPSGHDFLFGWNIKTWNMNEIRLNSSLLDTALEPGWYHLHVEIILKTGGLAYIDEEHIFDPPGTGSSGSGARGFTEAW
jgi:hypothetical protein